MFYDHSSEKYPKILRPQIGKNYDVKKSAYTLAIRGEKGVLAIAAADMLRQRWNPFYEYQEQRIVDHFTE